MNCRRNLCKFNNSTVEKDAKYLITNIIMYYLSNLKVIYHTEDTIFYVDEFDNILLNYLYPPKNCSPYISIARRELFKTLTYVF